MKDGFLVLCMGVGFFFIIIFIYYLTRLQSQKSKLWSFLAVRVLALSRPEVSASSYKQRTKRERGERRKKNILEGMWSLKWWGALPVAIRCPGPASKYCLVNARESQPTWLPGVHHDYWAQRAGGGG